MRDSLKYSMLVLLCLIVCEANSIAEESNADPAGWQWLQSGLTFRPTVASVFEPRVGFIFYGDRNNIRLDIGSGIDILSRRYRTGTISIGAEFFTFTLLESWENMHFPVIASDYFFGINVSYSQPVDNGIFSGRFRFTHISSHFVDGHYDADAGEWRDGRDPIIYSREFFGLLVAYQRNGSLIDRWYGGIQYMINLIPDWIGKFEFRGGYEVFLPSNWNYITPYAAIDLQLVDINGWNINHSFQTGVKLGHRFGRGIDLFIAYYNGYNVHGELFDEKIDYWGFGCNVHL